MFIRLFVFVAVVSVHAVLSAQDGEKTWEGTWRNRKFNTTGPLKCVASSDDGKTWQAQFDGTFMNDPFTYKVTFEGQEARGQTNLRGTATLDGDRYEWSGYIKENKLFGKFRSLKGYYGEFVLQEPRQ